MSNDRPLQVGDVCVITKCVTRPHILGREVTLERRFIGECDTSQGPDVCDGWIVQAPWLDGEWPGRRVICFDNDQLRRIDPPSKSEPRTDFIPCEPEFLEWMKNRGRVGA
jgi:hypothetical protein